MRVVFTKSPTGRPWNLAYNIDDTAELPEAKAKAMIDAGFAVELKQVQKETKKTAAPKSEKATKRSRRKETATEK